MWPNHASFQSIWLWLTKDVCKTPIPMTVYIKRPERGTDYASIFKIALIRSVRFRLNTVLYIYQVLNPWNRRQDPSVVCMLSVTGGCVKRPGLLNNRSTLVPQIQKKIPGASASIFLDFEWSKALDILRISLVNLFLVPYSFINGKPVGHRYREI